MMCHSESPKAVSEFYDTKRHKMLNPKTSFLFQHDSLMCHSETTQSDSESYDIEGHKMLNKFFRILTKRTIETKAICVSLSAVAQHDRLSAFTLSEVEISDGRRVRVTEPSPVSEDMEPTKPKACRRNYPSEKKFRLVNAFTLSEVLIAIGIIGVVAALVIPNLMQTMQNRDLVSKYLKVHNTLSNAYKNAEAVNGFKLYNLTPEQFKLKFSDELNIVEGTCDKDVCLTDGSSFEYVCNETNCTEIIVDTNGKKKPNSAGKDRYRFLITENGLLADGESSDYCGVDNDGGMDCGKYVLAHHKLFDGLINNCNSYENGRCSGCDDGYSLSGNTCHGVNLANCEKYTGISCSGCSNGYMLKNGVCTSLSDNNCTSTTDGEKCDVCSDKYTNNDGVCEEIEIADCKTYSGDSCSACNSGQYKNNGTTCELQPEVTGCKTYVNGECTEYNTLANCDNQTNYTCNTCKNGYYPDNGQCAKQNVENCDSYTANANTCTACKSGYYPSNGQCLAQNVQNCNTYVSNKNQCQSCKSGYYPSNGQCIAQNVPNCNSYTANTNSCTSCKSGYYPSNGQCIAQNVPNCNSYTANTNSCTSCKSGYYPSNGQCVAQNVPNCNSYTANTNSCTSCKSGYKLANGSCTALNIPGCTSYNGETCQVAIFGTTGSSNAAKTSCSNIGMQIANWQFIQAHGVTGEKYWVDGAYCGYFGSGGSFSCTGGGSAKTMCMPK